MIIEPVVVGGYNIYHRETMSILFNQSSAYTIDINTRVQFYIIINFWYEEGITIPQGNIEYIIHFNVTQLCPQF